MRFDIILIAFFAAVLTFSVCAGSEMISVDYQGGTYGPGDQVNLSFSITNEYDDKTNFSVESYLAYPWLPTSPSVRLLELGAGESITISEPFTVQETSESGDYTFYVTLFFNGTETEQENVTFVVSGTLDTFDRIYARTCSDLECDKVRTVFLLGEKAYLEVFNSEDAELAGDVIYPDGGTSGLSFTGGFAMIDIEPAGDYLVNLTASREGYMTESWMRRFTVIPEDIEFGDENVCVPDGECEGDENHQNCPQDCLPEEENNYYYLIIVLVVVVVAISAFVVKKFR